LAARYEVYYYFHKKECDFVTLDHGKLFGAYQVCAELTEQNHNRELEGLSQTMSKLGISRGFVLTFNIDQEIDYNGFKISILPVWKWLLSEYL
jgi:predicted AAA+ superfamily ATPase